MALLNNAPSAIYLSIVSGKIARRVKDVTPEAKSRTTEDGKLIHELYYDNLEGSITDISTKDGNFGKQLLITITSDGEKAVLQMPFSSGSASSFLKALPNVDLSQPVTLRPKMEVDGEKKKTVLFITQNGKGIKWYWTKDNPGALPPMEKIKVKGKETWDDSKQLEFFENFLQEVRAKLNPAPAAVDNNEDIPF